MSRPDKKQRNKLKRQAKRNEARRRDSISPVKRLAEAKGEVECWMSGNFETFGQTQFFVYKSAPGLNGFAGFLVDRGVVGLKDSWMKVRIDRLEFEEILKMSAGQGLRMSRCKLEQVRHFVAGGIRWAHDNGMRLPKDWAKATAFIGGVGDWASADVSRFEMEFAGHPDDLRRRLIAMPFEEYIQQTDIDFIFSDNAPVMDLGTGEYLDDDDLDDDEEFIDDEELLMEELNEMSRELTQIRNSAGGAD